MLTHTSATVFDLDTLGVEWAICGPDGADGMPIEVANLILGNERYRYAVCWGDLATIDTLRRLARAVMNENTIIRGKTCAGRHEELQVLHRFVTRVDVGEHRWSGIASCVIELRAVMPHPDSGPDGLRFIAAEFGCPIAGS